MKNLRFFDQLSKKPELLINGNARPLNYLGIFFGLGLISSLIISFIICIFLIIQRGKINVIYNVESNLDNFIEFNDVQFSLIPTDNNGNNIKDADRLYELKSLFVDYEIIDKKPKLIVKPIPLEECENNYNKIGAFNDSLMINAYKKIARCLNMKKNNITLHGNTIPGNAFSTINFYLNKCVNTTKKTDCFPNEEIDKRLNNIKLAVNIGDFDVNTKNQTDPFIPVRRGFLKQFSSTISRKHFYEINNIDFFSDNGLFFESFEKNSAYRIESSWESIKLDLGNQFFPTTFGNISFRGSGKKEIYNRTYQKITDFIPQIVSFYHIYILFAKFLVTFLTSGSLEEYFFSIIFNNNEFDDLKKSKMNINYEEILRNENLARKIEKIEKENNLRSENVENINSDKLKRNKSFFNPDKGNENNHDNKIKMKSVLVKRFKNKDDNDIENINENRKTKNRKFTQFNSKILSKRFKEEEIKEDNRLQSQNLNSGIPLQMK